MDAPMPRPPPVTKACCPVKGLRSAAESARGRSGAMACLGPEIILSLKYIGLKVQARRAAAGHAREADMRTLLPPGWPRPKGYSNGIAAEGKFVFVAGEVGWNPLTEKFDAKDFVGQFRQTLKNTLAIMAEGGAKPEHMVRMTWYVTDKAEYLASLKGVGDAWREIMGRVFPCIAAIEVKGLMEPDAKIEIETTAV